MFKFVAKKVGSEQRNYPGAKFWQKSIQSACITNSGFGSGLIFNIVPKMSSET